MRFYFGRTIGWMRRRVMLTLRISVSIDGTPAMWQSPSLPVGRCCLLFSPSFLFRGALVGEGGIFPFWRLVNDLAADHCEQDFRLSNLRGFNLEQILIDHNHVRQFPSFQRTLFFLAMGGIRGACRISLDGVFQRDALTGQKSARRFALGGLSHKGILHTRPWVKRDNGPIAAEGQHAARFLNAPPSPATLRPLRSDVRYPYFHQVVVRISVQRLKASDHPKGTKARDVWCGDGLDVLNARAGIALAIF